MNLERSETCAGRRLPQVSALKAVTIGLLLAVLLSGCQVIQSWLPAASTQPAVQTPMATPQPTGAAATATPEALPETQTLTIWLPPQFDPNNGTPAGDLLRDQLKAFADQNGLTLNVRIKAQSGPAGLLESLEITSLAAPSAMPSVIALPRDLMETAALKGLIYPLSGLNTSLEQSDWYAYASELASVQGTPFCIPFAGDALVMLYRPTRLPVPADDWQTILNTNQPLIFPAGDPQALLTLELYRAAGGQLRGADGRPNIDVSALTAVLELYQRGAQLSTFPFWLGEFSADSQAWQAYREQRASWVVTWASHYLSDFPADTNIARLPAFGNPVSAAAGWAWCITDPQPERRALGLQLSEHLAESGFLADWSQAAGYLPTRPSALAAWDNPSLSAPLQQILLNAHLRPVNEISDTLGPVLREAVLQVMQQHTDPAEAAQQAANQLTLPSSP